MKSMVDELLLLLLRPVRICLATAREASVLTALGRYECEVVGETASMPGVDLLIVDAGRPRAEALVREAKKHRVPVLVLLDDVGCASKLARISVVGILAHPVTADDIEQLFRVLKIRAREKTAAFVPPSERPIEFVVQS